MTRTINSPGIQVNEIDRSLYYTKTDNSLPHAPASLICGFSSKGEDYSIQWIDSKNTFINQLGAPATEFEQYFYSAVCETIDKGGVCIAAKLPYHNDSYDKYNYVEYSVDSNVQTIDSSSKLVALSCQDSYLTSFLEIQSNGCGRSSTEEFDNLLTRTGSAVIKDKIRIYDITRSRYDEYVENCVSTDVGVSTELITNNEYIPTNECLGIVPVITTASNALLFLNLIENANLTSFSGEDALNSLTGSLRNIEKYNPVGSDFKTLEASGILTDFSGILDWINTPFTVQTSASLDIDLYLQNDSISRQVSQLFPTIQYDGPDHFDKTYLKHIGVVVLKASTDTAGDNGLKFSVLESFVGSLDPSERDQISKKSVFIDDIVNTLSEYIRLFSNANKQALRKVQILNISQQDPVSLGFYEKECKKLIDLDVSITKGLNTILTKSANLNTMQIDIVCDAGVSNIALIVASNTKSSSECIDTDTYPRSRDYVQDMKSESDVSEWKAILNKFDIFCKNTRQDCMFIADGMRPFCLSGDQKIVRSTDISSTVSKSILPKLKFMQALNSSYSAGYCDWLLTTDDYSGDSFWCPPSIKALGAYIYCDTYFHKWDAPAGMTRGIVANVSDCAFSPNVEEAGRIYTSQWNYAVSYPLNGIIIEGLKTFLTEKTALDRINVRRMLLDLEKLTIQIGRHFVYEGNTEYIRQKYVDALKDVFEAAVSGNGLKEYAIRCDDELNTAQVIDNNEMRCRIAVKPVKTLEYIVLDFICTTQSASVMEEVMR